MSSVCTQLTKSNKAKNAQKVHCSFAYVGINAA